ncbi:MAG: succinate dehydrogenase cytochrome b subunit [Bacteroidetes bacterium]|nr:succinate dehydrogenase cytochrome b subunit [Bacteroidota bacterium]
MSAATHKSSALFKSSLGKKYLMGLTGLFLISFLLVHCFVNAMVFFDRSGSLFNEYAHFMGTNIIIRIMEVVLFAGLLLHIIDGLMLYFQNRAARPQGYAYNKPNANSSWYSRSMAILGTLLLTFLIMHLAHFWVHSRFMEDNMLKQPHPDFKTDMLNLYSLMVDTFSNPIVVVIYVLAQVALAYHLLHGFWSAFQSLGLNHTKYNNAIHMAGTAFAIVIPFIFALMPIVIYLRTIGVM